MLRIERLELEDFGPFKGRQVLALPDDPGVVVVYGENMRGKTSLLNAIRFALFGKVLGRGRREGSLHQIGNWERASEGKFGFEVALDFSTDGHGYRLTRSCRPRQDVTANGDEDYVVEWFLQKDGDVLGPDQARSELDRIMPEQIARFSLFDGELLQEYEDLLRDESDMGRQISEAIERILGVPVLTGSRATLGRLRDDYDKREAKAAQADQMTAELGVHLEGLQETRRVLQDGLRDMRERVDRLRTDKAALEEDLRRAERFAAVMDKRDALRRSIEELERKIAEKSSAIATTMSSAWRPLVAERAELVAIELRKEERELETRRMRHEVLASLRVHDGAECPACLQPVSEGAFAKLEHLAAQDETAAHESETRLRTVQRRLAVLEQTARDRDHSVLHLLWSDLNGFERDRYAKIDEADELDRRLQEIDEAALRKTQSEHEQTVRTLAVVEEGIRAQQEQLDENERTIAKVRSRLETAGGADLSGLRRQRALCTDLYDLFNGAVSAYRERLRAQVEADASSLFLQLTTEPDYVGLRINESYGLTIVHQDGSDIPIRSAGAEHVVALSLVGALQRNAPLRGPIFIDSPFGRLDSQHTKNVVSALPAMSDQVCLLVYEDELQPGLARQLLKGQLRAEYVMRRVTSRHTELERLAGT
jgi:DNA sulfur modification protein DndD